MRAIPGLVTLRPGDANEVVEAYRYILQLRHEPAVLALRDRLRASGDLRDETSYPNHFGSSLETAVKRFQASNGLAPTW